MVLHIIVLIFEILYYSMFMKFTKKEGKFWKYLLLFTLITIILFIFNTNNLYVYLIFILLALYGLKYIVNVKISLYDMFVIFTMLILKLIIETPIYFILYKYVNIYINGIITGLIKFLILFLLKDKLNIVYINLKKKWDILSKYADDTDSKEKYKGISNTLYEMFMTEYQAIGEMFKGEE